jgi:alpha-beta hydrolase superfamily lysophospholipase
VSQKDPRMLITVGGLGERNEHLWPFRRFGTQWLVAPSPFPGMGWRNRVREVIHFTSTIAQETPSPYCILAHSAGCPAALRAVREIENKPEAMVLFAPAPMGWINVMTWKLLRRTTKYTWPMVLGRPFMPGRDDYKALGLSGLSGEIQDELLGHIQNIAGWEALAYAIPGLRPQVPDLDVPILVVIPVDDQWVKSGAQAALARNIADKNDSVTGVFMVGNAGHFFFWDPAHNDVLDAVETWLQNPYASVRGFRVDD